MSGRLFYIDWLRVIAFAILIVYHCSVAFFPDMPWLVKSTQTDQTLSWIMDFPRAWRLALLFFVSGMGTWFAFRAAPDLGFLRDRVIRLGVPLIFAMCVVVVPQVWLERIIEEGYHGSLVTFWFERYFTEGRYPTGNFTWAHMWFVAYLLVMAVFCYPIFRIVIDPRLRWLSDRFAALANTPAVYLFFLLPLVLNLALSPIFPRQTNALYNDGAWFAVWTSWFGLGFLFARHHKELIEGIVARRWTSLGLAAVLTVALYRFAFLPEPGSVGSIGSYDNETPLFKALHFSLAWTMILSAVGFGALHLNRRSAALTWLNAKVFPLYIVHQTVIIWALFHVLPLDIGMWSKFGLVIAITAALSMAIAVAADSLPWPLRLLLGLAGRSPEATAKAAARPRS